MQVKLIVLPGDDVLTVVIWGKWRQGTMRVRQFETRTSMVSVLENLGLLSSKQAGELLHYTFAESCPLFSAEIDEETLVSHGFRLA